MNPACAVILAAKKLRERHGIDLATETVRRIMIDAGFWVPRKLRPPKVHQPRNRCACLGELVQIDSSDHAWHQPTGGVIDIASSVHAGVQSSQGRIPAQSPRRLGQVSRMVKKIRADL